MCESQQLAVGHTLPELPSSFLPTLSNCLLFKSCGCPNPPLKHLKFISHYVLSPRGKENQVDTFETWKIVHLPPGCFQSQSLNTEPTCARAPRQVLGSLEETQLPLFPAECHDSGAALRSISPALEVTVTFSCPNAASSLFLGHGSKPWVPSTSAGGLRELLSVPLSSNTCHPRKTPCPRV